MIVWMPSLVVMLSARTLIVLFLRSMPVTAWSLSLTPRIKPYHRRIGEGGEEFVEIAAHFLLKVDPPPFEAGKKSREVIHETRPHTMPDRRDLCSRDPGFARETQCP